MDSKKLQKVATNFCCEFCHYNTSRKSSYEKHLATDKHKMVVNDSKKLQKVANLLQCSCGKIYKYDSGYYRHKKKCSHSEKPNETGEILNYLMKENNDFKQLLIEQNKQMVEIVKNVGNYNITNNSNNRTFNLNIFLNETCKNAMNITEFIDSLHLQLSDLEKVGEIGYIEGISNIIIKNLNAMDVTERPIHCTDKKRETMYIKDEDKWEKENERKEKMHRMVKKIANKNINLITAFQELYPEYKKISSKYSDQYNKIIIESMGGKGENEHEKEEKIIKKIAKEVFVDKI